MEHKYEGIYILAENVTEEEINKSIKNLTAGIKIDKINKLGKKKLAFEVRGNKEGYYIQIFYKCIADKVYKMEETARADDNIIKFINVKLNDEDYNYYVNEEAK
jgi:small subunit ribosomal protein S6